MRTDRIVAILFVALTALTYGCTAAPTAMPLPPTPDARATETTIAANIFATQTANAPTPTNTATPTSIPSATPTETERPTATPLPSATSTPASDTTVVVTKDFSSDCLYTSDNSDRAYGCENGEYTILNKGKNQAWWMYLDDNYDDTVVEADARSLAGTAGLNFGIILRTSSDGDYFYYFAVDPVDGQYALYYHDPSKWNELIPYTDSGQIKKGSETNHLKIVAQGTQIALYINGQFLDTVADNSLSNGRVGFLLGSTDANGKVAFDNLSIAKINRPLALPAVKARPPTPTPSPTIPAGMGGVIVDDFCGFDVFIEIGGKRYTIPTHGRIYIYLPPGHYPVSATANGQLLVCGGGGCSLDVQENYYTPYPYCGR